MSQTNETIRPGVGISDDEKNRVPDTSNLKNFTLSSIGVSKYNIYSDIGQRFSDSCQSAS